MQIPDLHTLISRLNTDGLTPSEILSIDNFTCLWQAARYEQATKLHQAHVAKSDPRQGELNLEGQR